MATPPIPAAGPPGRTVKVGRRVFLGMFALGTAGVAFGSAVQSKVSRTLGSGLGSLLPGGDQFQIYSITGSFPIVAPDAYRLTVSGLVDKQLTLTLDDLQSMPAVRLVRQFQCVTGWRVPDVHWEGVRLGDVLDAAGVQAGGAAVLFDSYDGADTESLTLAQARLDDVIVAFRMLGGPISVEHGGPVRLYVAPMFGYKSIKWLSAIKVSDTLVPGYWEENGYPVNGWLDGSTAPTIPPNA